MLDLISFSGPLEVFERSSLRVTARFRDRDQFAGVVPTSVYWRLDDEAGCAIVDWTQITPAAAEVSVQISAEQNRILNCARHRERKTLTIMADRGLATQFAAAFVYDVANLQWAT